MNAPIQATQQEKFDAFEWLRSVAVSDDPHSRHAAVMLVERALAVPQLADGEVYVGVLVVDGAPSHHLVLLPGDKTGLTWKKAGAWAKAQGGELPTRKEQALLFANAAGAFWHAWYLSCEQSAGNESYAWCQNFDFGIQGIYFKSSELRTRAVRRIPIE